jgi:hypothetical protein
VGNSNKFIKYFLIGGIIIVVSYLAIDGFLTAKMMENENSKKSVFEQPNLEDVVKIFPDDERAQHYNEKSNECLNEFNSGTIGFDEMSDCLDKQKEAYYNDEINFVKETESNSIEISDSEIKNDDWKKIAFSELYDDDGKRLDKYDETAWRVYAEKIPDYSHNSITSKIITDALESWKSANPNLKFIQVDKHQDSNIVIKWVTYIPNPNHVMGITNSEITEFLDGSFVLGDHEILIDLADLDCNENPIFWDKETITDTIKHEIGHAVGIEYHSSNENHLMYDPDDGTDFFHSSGLTVPEKITYGYYVGEREVREEMDGQNEKFVRTLAEYGWSVDDWENNIKSSSNAIFYDKVNGIIEEMNPVIEKTNCYSETTNKYDPYT